jgi:hypothetical protein
MAGPAIDRDWAVVAGTTPARCTVKKRSRGNALSGGRKGLSLGIFEDHLTAGGNRAPAVLSGIGRVIGMHQGRIGGPTFLDALLCGKPFQRKFCLLVISNSIAFHC